MISHEEILQTNKNTWNLAAETTDTPRSNLPFWGPYNIGPNLNLLPEIKDKTFFEIGCGSGRSIQYLLKNGARLVHGLDLSDEQIKRTRRKLKTYFPSSVQLHCQSMEEQAPILDPVDYVLSIYALGWTYDLDLTFQNIASYLKPGGKLIFSWEHPAFNRTWWNEKEIIWNRPYFGSNPSLIENFRRIGPAYLFPRTHQDWIQALIRNGLVIIDYFEPEPLKITKKNHPNHGNYYADQKAQNLPCTMIFVCQKA